MAVVGCTLALSAGISAEGRSHRQSTTASAQKQETGDSANSASGPALAPRPDTTVALNRRRYDLAKSADLEAFLQSVKSLQALSKDEKDEKKAEKGDGASGKKKEKSSEKKLKKTAKSQAAERPEKGDKKLATGSSEKGDKKVIAENLGVKEGEGDGEEGAEAKTGKSHGKGGRDWSSKKVRLGLKAMEQIATALQKGETDWRGTSTKSRRSRGPSRATS